MGKQYKESEEQDRLAQHVRGAAAGVSAGADAGGVRHEVRQLALLVQPREHGVVRPARKHRHVVPTVRLRVQWYVYSLEGPRMSCPRLEYPLYAMTCAWSAVTTMSESSSESSSAARATALSISSVSSSASSAKLSCYLYNLSPYQQTEINETESKLKVKRPSRMCTSWCAMSGQRAGSWPSSLTLASFSQCRLATLAYTPAGDALELTGVAAVCEGPLSDGLHVLRGVGGRVAVPARHGGRQPERALVGFYATQMNLLHQENLKYSSRESGLRNPWNPCVAGTSTGELCLLAGVSTPLAEQCPRGRECGHGHAVAQEHDHVACFLDALFALQPGFDSCLRLIVPVASLGLASSRRRRTSGRVSARRVVAVGGGHAGGPTCLLNMAFLLHLCVTCACAAAIRNLCLQTASFSSSRTYLGIHNRIKYIRYISEMYNHLRLKKVNRIETASSRTGWPSTCVAPLQACLPGPMQAAYAMRCGSWLCSYSPVNMEWCGPRANTATSSPPCVPKVPRMSLPRGAYPLYAMTCAWSAVTTMSESSSESSSAARATALSISSVSSSASSAKLSW
ncbi:hypothetical protein HW555_008599 [Spodoptera exigua]|uniref:Uncharacterized protein n=1 Tax=Spodoptera exigua TaxID=7107 RepID=A0A835L1K6_SPOEX|nr:hypothetical protein HW555_008599 [Spodoptera exigua]